MNREHLPVESVQYSLKEKYSQLMTSCSIYGLAPKRPGFVFTATTILSLLFLLQLRLAVVEAIGYAVNLLSPESLNEQLPRLIPGVTQLYRKHAEHYYITQVCADTL